MNTFNNKINRPKWMENKYLLPVLDAFITAALSDRIFDVLKNPPKHFKKLQLTEVPNIKKWLTFYEKDIDDISLEWMGNYLSEEMKNPAFGKLVVAHLKYHQRRVNALRSRAHKIIPNVDERIILKLIDEFEKWDLDEVEEFYDSLPMPESPNKYENDDTFLFLYKVWYPCHYLFGKNPDELFNEAKKGDLDSLIKLLKIDKSIIRDPKIAEYIIKESIDLESDNYKSISRALVNTAKVNTLKKLKGILASYISAGSKLWGQKLNSRQIIDLFDIAAKIKNPEALQDDDFLDEPATLTKTIQRKAPLYENHFKLDKK